MSTAEVIRAWQDERYRSSLGAGEQALLPGNPAGLVELSDLDLEGIVGGQKADGGTHTSLCCHDGCNPTC
jgi:mersacidin/lichenicidin family type 2 lantibiotic